MELSLSNTSRLLHKFTESIKNENTSIYGIGCDILHIPRVERLLNKPYINRFLHKSLSVIELQQYNQLYTLHQQINYISSRWCIKESLVKAAQHRLLFTDITVTQKYKQPRMIELHNTVLQYFHAQNIQYSEIQSTLSHEQQYCVAVVVLDKYIPQHINNDTAIVGT